MSGIARDGLPRATTGATAPRVSVVVPAYNATRWIGRTIESVLRQIFTDYELIVIDDGSTDDLDRALEPYLARSDRIRVVRQDNRGLAAARNRGVSEARAELVAPLDADDIWHPAFLQETVAALDGDPAAPFAFAYSFRMDEEDRLYPYQRPATPPRHDLIGLIWTNSVGNGSAALYRKALVVEAGGYDEEMGRKSLPGAEDWKLVLRLARRGEPTLIERPLVGYRLLESSMSQQNPRRQLNAVLAVLAELRAEMPEIAGRHFADGRTGMTAWLLPAFARRMEFGEVFTGSYHAYIRNPLWFRNPSLRRSHLSRLKAIGGFLAGRMNREGRPLPPLHTLPFEGDYPFAFLAPDEAQKR